MIAATTVTATGQVNLGNGSDETVSRFAVQFDVVSGTISATVKGRLTGSALAFVAIYYTDYADGTVKTAALTADKLILIDASGLDIQLDVTVTSGSCVVYATPLIG